MCVFVLQVIILDPTQENASELLSVAEMFYANNIPLRLVFVSPGIWWTIPVMINFLCNGR